VTCCRAPVSAGEIEQPTDFYRPQAGTIERCWRTKAINIYQVVEVGTIVAVEKHLVGIEMSDLAATGCDRFF
jgi:hypothetical protein